MEGIIINFRGSHKTQYTNQLIVEIESIKNKEQASKLVGKKVVWKSPAGKEISGLVAKEHGNKGALRVRFEKGLPGQALGEKVEIK